MGNGYILLKKKPRLQLQPWFFIIGVYYLSHHTRVAKLSAPWCVTAAA